MTAINHSPAATWRRQDQTDLTEKDQWQRFENRATTSRFFVRSRDKPEILILQEPATPEGAGFFAPCLNGFVARREGCGIFQSEPASGDWP